MNRIRSNKIILGDSLFDGYVYFEDGKIIAVTDDDIPSLETFDCTGHYVSAGFIDIHTHGGGGYPFEGSVDDVINGCNFHLLHGTTSICPTISAAEFPKMSRSAKNVAKAMADASVLGTIIGSHLEGPYLSAKQAGAQCPDFITPPNKDDYLALIQECGDSIARWTYAPENDENAYCAKALRENGIVASAGHTDAIYSDMLKAAENGCKLVTHLYSCTSTVTRDHGFRRLGVIESAFLMEDIYAEIICDGKHLPPELIRLIVKIKGVDNVVLVTDSLALAGTDVKHGFMQSTEYVIEDGVCKLMDRTAFAGSIATADRLVRVAVKEAGISIFDAIKMITVNPARVMRLQNKGSLSAGMDADIVVFDDDINIRSVFANGEKHV
jgi:N-acetylglucosamine-6-phosphate deacetylase